MKKGRCEIYPVQISQEIRQDARFRAELSFYDRLSEQLGQGWLVIYHAPFISSGSDGKFYDGEADFIISHEELGTAVIEVKGGEIHSENGQWKSITLQAGREHNIQNPEEQARRCKWAIVKKLANLPDIRRLFANAEDELKRHLCHGVCFPDVIAPRRDLSAALPYQLVIDANHLANLEKKLREILALGCKNSERDAQARKWIQTGLRQLFATQVKLRHPLLLTAIEDEQQLITLTQQQYDALFQLRFRSRAAIIGCAGSGKTFLAAQEALMSAQAGQRTLLTCFNRPLAAFLRRMILEHPNLDVINIHALCGKLANQAGIEVPEDSENLYRKELPEALSAAMSRLPEARYDCIIVDEAQDISLSTNETGNTDFPEGQLSEQKELMWLAIEDSLKDSVDSRLYAFFDTHQSLYGNACIPEELKPPIPLPQNVRNTQSICSAVKLHYEGIIPISSRGPTGASIQTVACEDESLLSKILVEQITRLTKIERFSNSDIVILTPRKRERSNVRLAPHFNAVWDIENEASGAKDILCSSIHRFKGLERRIAIVTELEELDGKEMLEQKRLCYTAFSRPRLLLLAVGKRKTLDAYLSPNDLVGVV